MVLYLNKATYCVIFKISIKKIRIHSTKCLNEFNVWNKNIYLFCHRGDWFPHNFHKGKNNALTLTSDCGARTLTFAKYHKLFQFGWVLYRAFGLRLVECGNDVTLMDIYQNNVFYGLIEIHNTVKHKINSKFKLRTIYNRNNAETNIQKTLAVFSMIILAMLRVFLFKVQPENNTNHNKLSVVPSKRGKIPISCFDVL